MSESAPIDIHAHYFPAPYLKLIAAEGGPFGGGCDLANPKGPVIKVGTLRAGPLAPKFTDLDLRLEAMQEQGVAVQALSLTQPMVYWAGGPLGQKLSATYNDGLAEAHQAHPDKLFGLAMLPMQAPQRALAELERAAGLPGIRGVYMATRILGWELSHPALFPVYERIEALGLPIFLHPSNVIGQERLRHQWYLTNLLGNPFEGAIAATHLILGGVLDRFPKLTFVLPHAGGAFPYVVGRVTHGWRVREECRHLKNPPDSYLRRFCYDTISHSPDALKYLIGLVGADRILLGSDYCFNMGDEHPVQSLDAVPGLSAEDREAILAGNARRLLGL